MDDKELEMRKKAADQMAPLFIDDTEIVKLMEAYIKDKNVQTFNAMLNLMPKVPIVAPSQIGEDKKAHPMFIKDREDRTWLPVYTTFSRMPQGEHAPKSDAVTKVGFMEAVRMVQETDCDGIVVNAFAHNIFLQRELVNKILKVETEKIRKILDAKEKGIEVDENGNPKGKPVELTEEQYDAMMRQQVEFALLPKKFFEDGQNLVDDLSDRKEEAMDAFYEDSYQMKRMYPYVLDDFHVMPLDINEDLTIIRIDMPSRKLVMPCCLRVYLAWNSKEQTGRYFTVEITKEEDVHNLGEVSATDEANKFQRTVIEQGITEGAELQTVVELVS